MGFSLLKAREQWIQKISKGDMEGATAEIESMEDALPGKMAKGYRAEHERVVGLLSEISAGNLDAAASGAEQVSSVIRKIIEKKIQEARERARQALGQKKRGRKKKQKSDSTERIEDGGLFLQWLNAILQEDMPRARKLLERLGEEMDSEAQFAVIHEAHMNIVNALVFLEEEDCEKAEKILPLLDGCLRSFLDRKIKRLRAANFRFPPMLPALTYTPLTFQWDDLRTFLDEEERELRRLLPFLEDFQKREEEQGAPHPVMLLEYKPQPPLLIEDTPVPAANQVREYQEKQRRELLELAPFIALREEGRAEKEEPKPILRIAYTPAPPLLLTYQPALQFPNLRDFLDEQRRELQELLPFRKGYERRRAEEQKPRLLLEHVPEPSAQILEDIPEEAFSFEPLSPEDLPSDAAGKEKKMPGSRKKRALPVPGKLKKITQKSALQKPLMDAVASREDELGLLFDISWLVAKQGFQQFRDSLRNARQKDTFNLLLRAEAQPVSKEVLAQGQELDKTLRDTITRDVFALNEQLRAMEESPGTIVLVPVDSYRLVPVMKNEEGQKIPQAPDALRGLFQGAQQLVFDALWYRRHDVATLQDIAYFLWDTGEVTPENQTTIVSLMHKTRKKLTEAKQTSVIMRVTPVERVGYKVDVTELSTDEKGSEILKE